jgi:hypothetical protein
MIDKGTMHLTDQPLTVVGIQRVATCVLQHFELEAKGALVT